MGPFVVASLPPFFRRGRISQISLQPISDDVVVELLGPQHASKTLAHHVPRIGREVLRNDGGVELISFTLAKREGPVEAFEGTLAFESGVRKAHTNYNSFSRSNCQLVVGSRLGAGMFRIDGFVGAENDAIVDPVFNIGCAVLDSKQPPEVGFVLREQQFGGAFTIEPAIAKVIVF